MDEWPREMLQAYGDAVGESLWTYGFDYIPENVALVEKAIKNKKPVKYPKLPEGAKV